MAKWGEGDPRWIVEERPDATNVNNWHWTEKNADAWSKKKLEELLVGLKIEDRDSKAEVTEMDKCEGEARANNRKAKLILFYEWEIVLKWKAKGTDKDDEDVEGKITIPNLSEEHTDMSDVDLEVTVTKGSGDKAAGKLKDMLRKGKGAGVLRGALTGYVEALKSEFSQGLILPPKDSTTAAPTVKKTPPAKSVTSKSSQQSSPPNVQQAMKGLELNKKGTTGDLTTIKLNERFKCTGQELFNALTQKEMMQVFTAGSVEMEGAAEAGRDFKMLGGNIAGKYVQVTPFTKIKQKWRLKDWPEGHFSDVEFTLKQSSEDTELDIVQTGVPAAAADNARMGWRRYYVDAIKRSFGFGSMF